jgi:hypothetical protein
MTILRSVSLSLRTSQSTVMSPIDRFGPVPW